MWHKKQIASDIHKAKSRLTDYALKYSVDGYSSMSGSVMVYNVIVDMNPYRQCW